MISRIVVKNLAIIQNVDLSLCDSLNVLTGETGAGKSFLIKALSLCLGSKASPDDVREGCSSASVVLEFLVPDTHRALVMLSEHGVPADAEVGQSSIMVRRLILKKGRPQAWVNDVPITVGLLRNLALHLVEICGQHDNQRLSQNYEHARFLDQLLMDKQLKHRYKESYDAVQQQLAAVRKFCNSYQRKYADYDYYKYRKNEIDGLGPSEEDFSLLESNSEKLSDHARIKSVVDAYQESIDFGAGGASLSGIIWTLLNKFRKDGERKELDEVNSDLVIVAEKLEDISFRLSLLDGRISEDIAGKDMDLNRLDLYRSLMRKSNVSSVKGLLDDARFIDEEIKFVDAAEESFSDLLTALYRAIEDLRRIAASLTKARQKASRSIEKALGLEFKELGMPKAAIKVCFEQVKKSVLPPDFVRLEGYEQLLEKLETLSSFGKQGSESASFDFISNPGEPPKPLAQIASGGEMSRIMLGLKKSLAIGADTCVLVFDEIDVGISGRVADMVGRKLHELGANFQVLVVSHLPQVAAYAQSHFLVEKRYKNKKTDIRIMRMDKKQRKSEIARLLSGDVVTRESINNAQALIEKAASATA